MNDTVALKVTSLQRCVARARSAHKHAAGQFSANYDLQDAAILNILRACETAIDLANMLIRSRQLGMPTDNREAFSILQREGWLNEALTQRMKAMVGFRNLAVHQYREIDISIVEHILDHELDTCWHLLNKCEPPFNPRHKTPCVRFDCNCGAEIFTKFVFQTGLLFPTSLWARLQSDFSSQTLAQWRFLKVRQAFVGFYTRHSEEVGCKTRPTGM